MASRAAVSDEGERSRRGMWRGRQSLTVLGLKGGEQMLGVYAEDSRKPLEGLSRRVLRFAVSESSLWLMENRSDGGKSGPEQNSEEVTPEARVGDRAGKNGCHRYGRKT